MHLLKGGRVMSKQTTSPDFLACIPHVIEPHWDNVWAPRLAGFPVVSSVMALSASIAIGEREQARRSRPSMVLLNELACAASGLGSNLGLVRA